MSHSILCLDVGGTRVKASVLTQNPTLNELKNLSLSIFSSDGFWSNAFPTLVDSEQLEKRITEKYSKISIGLSGLVLDKRTFLYWKHRHIPQNLAAACEETSHLPVCIANDGVNWTLGAISLQEQLDKPVNFPCIGITLGTGVGLTLFRSSHSCTVIELSFVKWSFHRLYDEAKKQNPEKSNQGEYCHSRLGNKFFEWLGNSQPNIEEAAIQSIYTQRVKAFISDLEEFLQSTFKIQQASNILIGGGNAWLLPVDAFTSSVTICNSKNLSHHGLSPDVISLLGAVHRSSKELSIEPYPSLDIIEEELKSYS